MLPRTTPAQILLDPYPPRKHLDRNNRRQLGNGHKNQHKLSVLTARFRNALRKSVEGIIEAGRVLIEAKSELEHGQFIDWVVNELRFGTRKAGVRDADIRKAELLMFLARNEVISKSCHWHDFPPSPRTLWELTQIRPKQRLLELIANGTINSGMTREEAVALRQGNGTSREIFWGGDDGVLADLNDECHTPGDAVAPILKYIPKRATVWCPFDKSNSEFVKQISLTNKVTYSHINEGQDFFYYEPKKWDVMISNPPFAGKRKIFERALSFNKPFALIMSNIWLNDSAPMQLFKDKDLQLLMFDRRIKFNLPDGRDNAQITFSSSYYCWNFLPKQIVMEVQNKTGRLELDFLENV
jgi:hypothetical protein